MIVPYRQSIWDYDNLPIKQHEFAFSRYDTENNSEKATLG